MRNPTVPSGFVRICAEIGIRGSETGTGYSVPRKDAVPADTMRRTDAIAGGEPTPDYPVGAERASVETIGGGENLLTEKAAGIQTGIITGARKEREVLPEVETELDSAEVIPEEMDTAEENEWRQRPLRVSVKEQEITREELTATVLQRYLQNNHPEFEQLEIRHSEEGEQLHGEVGKLSYAFLFFEDLIQFDISAKRKGGKELEEKLERIGKKVPGVQFQYSKGEGRVYASGFLTKDLTPKQAMKQVFEVADYFRG